VLNSILKISTVTPIPPSVILPSSIPTGEMIPSVPRGERNGADVKKQTPVQIKVKQPKSMER